MPLLHASNVRRDIAFAIRGLYRRPGFAASVVVTLALGIGANTAVFSLLDAIILHPVAVADADRVVAVYDLTGGSRYGGSTFGSYRALATHSSTLTGIAAYTSTTLSSKEGDASQNLDVAFVTENYFTVLGVRATMGQVFGQRASGFADNGRPNPVVVLSGTLWRTRFGADPGIVGKEIHLSGQPFTVVGVAPERFQGTNLTAIPDLWAPVSMIPPLHLDLLSFRGHLNESMPIFSLIGRLAPGVVLQQAITELNGINQQQINATGTTTPLPSPAVGRAAAPLTLNVMPIAESAAPIRDRATLDRFLGLLTGIVGLILALACTNVANLLSVRAGERAKELGIRTAMGATVTRLAGQLVTESVVLALAGGAAGLAVAIGIVRLISAFGLPGGLALDGIDLGLNLRVLLFTGVVCVLAAIAFGATPSVRAARRNVIDVLRDSDDGRPALRGRGTLLASQVAITLMLVVGAGLFLRSVRAGLTTDLGFDPEPLAALTLMPRFTGSHADNVRPFLDIVARMREMPGIIAAAASTHVPLGGAVRRAIGAGPATASSVPDRQSVVAGVGNIAGDYFKVLGVPLLAGRVFTPQDGPASPRVIIVNEALARALWPGESALGRLVHARGATYTVVGVARDIKYMTLHDEATPFAYVPMIQEDYPIWVSVVVRSSRPRVALTMLRETAHAIAPELAKPDLKSLGPRLVTDQIDSVLAPQRLGATLLSIFAVLAALICGVGIYGTVSYTVARRTTAIGIRVALGAQRVHVLSLVLSDVGLAVIVGVVLGVFGAAATGRLLAHFLYGVSASDWVAFTGAVVLVAVVAIGAVSVPASRAVRIDPARSIRASQ